MVDGLGNQAEALFVAGDWLLLVLPQKLLVYQTRGLLEKTIEVDLGETLRDAALHNDTLYLLGTHNLYKTGWAEFAPQAGN